MANTRLIIFKILFLILIARCSLIETSHHSESDRTRSEAKKVSPNFQISLQLKQQQQQHQTSNLTSQAIKEAEEKHTDLISSSSNTRFITSSTTSLPLISIITSSLDHQRRLTLVDREADPHQSDNQSERNTLQQNKRKNSSFSNQQEKKSDSNDDTHQDQQRQPQIQEVDNLEISSDDQAKKKASADNRQDEETPNQVAKSEKLTVKATYNLDELCFLSNGGSSLTLTVNEATPVGSIVGSIEVNGDPSIGPEGNIDLTDLPSAGNSANNNSLSSTSTSELLSSADDWPIARQRRRLERRWADWWPPFTNSKLSSGQQQQQHHNQQQQQADSDQIKGDKTTHGDHEQGRANLQQQHPSREAPRAPASSSPKLVSPVQLDRGTKNLILVRALDKEGPESEQSVLINVKCQPRGQQHEQTIIPVRLIVTDANDNAPEFQFPNQHQQQQQIYIFNISEATPIGSLISRDIQAIDRDSAGPHSTIHYRVEEDGSQHAHLLHFPNPLEPALRLAAQLDYESLPTFSLTILAQDQGEPEPLVSRAQVQINVIDSDDQNPKFLDDKYTLIMDESQQNSVGQNLRVLPHSLRAQDGDRAIQAPILYTLELPGGAKTKLTDQSADYDQETLITSGQLDRASSTSATQLDEAAEPNAANIERYLHLSRSSGEIRLLRVWPSDWNNGPLTLVVRATQADNRDRYTLTTLTISSKQAAAAGLSSSGTSSLARSLGLNDQKQQHPAGKANGGLQFTQNKVSFLVAENAPVNERIGQVRTVMMDQAEAPAGGSQQGDSMNESVDLISSSGSLLIGASTSTGSNQDEEWPRQPRQMSVGKQPVPSSGTGKQRLSGRQAGSGQQTSSSTNGAKTATTTNQQASPISYQILDDQTDQFGVNQGGEIFLKKSLDFEQRQEFLFRILATHSRYSDICLVQVNVMNVNDNKPKFTQPQYSFHLTESRLHQSALIGTVQAQDADLKDPVRYSISGEHAHLFEMDASSGQLSLRSMAASNTSNLAMPAPGNSCLLLVHATDSLGPKQHNQTARINLLIASKLAGRSLASLWNDIAKRKATSGLNSDKTASLDQVDWANTNGPAYRTSGGSPPGSPGSQSLSSERQIQASSSLQQRSSLATVMSSLQHMIRSASLSEMPLPSALLLSALLALLICLLLVVVVAMSVHFFRRKTKMRQHRHQLMAASLAQVASAHFRNQQQGPGFAPGPGPNPNGRLLMPAPNVGHHVNTQPTSGSSSAANSILSAGLRSGRVAPRSPPYKSVVSFEQSLDSKQSIDVTKMQQQQQQRTNKSGNKSRPWLGKKDAKRSVQSSDSSSNSVLSTSASSSGPAELPGVAGSEKQAKRSMCQNGAPVARSSSKQQQQKSTSGSDNSLISTSVCSSCHSKSTNCGSDGTCKNTQDAKTKPDQCDASDAGQMSPIEQMRAINEQIRQHAKTRANHNHSSDIDYPNDESDDDGSSINKCGHYSLNRNGATYDKRSPASGDESSRLQCMLPDQGQQATGQLHLATSGQLSMPGDESQRDQNQQLEPISMSLLSPAELNIKSYRKLELQNSPQLRNGFELSLNQNQPPGKGATTTLMGMIKEQRDLSANSMSIRWPQEAIAQRVKQLSWDDELSLANTDQLQDSAHCVPSPLQQHQQQMASHSYHTSSYKESLTDLGSQHLPPPMDTIASYGSLIKVENSPLSPLQLSNAKTSVAMKSLELGSNSCSFLFSAPNSPSQSDLNEWLTRSSDVMSPNPQGGHPLLKTKSNGSNPTSGQLQMQQNQQQQQQSTSLCCEGQDNCFDYTIVQSSQFHVDSFVSNMQHANSNANRPMVNLTNGGRNQSHHAFGQLDSMPMTIAN